MMINTHGDFMFVNSGLMLTLGHNSSAIYFDGKKAIGYEEERLNRIKSSSAYPRLAIEEIEKNASIIPGSYVFISHWFDNFDFDQATSKYFDKEHFDALVSKYSLKKILLSENFTHHDAHARSVLSFMADQWDHEKHEAYFAEDDELSIIVADGFGNSQEAISIYGLHMNEDEPNLALKKRFYGYQYSLGLMYQYATSFCGMKENQDEYKFLGYETHISSILSQRELDLLRSLAADKAQQMCSAMTLESDGRPENWKTDGFINVEYLMSIKDQWHKHYADVLEKVSPNTRGRNVRVVIGHYIQELIENVLTYLVKTFNVKHIALAGGIFYNVKLNNKILNNVPGLFSVVPLAGDQGCGIGMYESFIGEFKWGDLKWGHRPSFANWKSQISANDLKKYGDYIKFYSQENRNEAVSDTIDLVTKNKLVNVVKSRMEFGPRALCSTTTLALPTSSNVMVINDLNERDTVMPMAPVVLDSAMNNFFDESISDRVVGSDKFMILTYDYKNPDLQSYGGVAHKYPDREVWSGRPQRVLPDDTFMHDVLTGIESNILINTSFNAHGRPIVYAFDSVIDSFKFEFDRALQLNFDLPYLFLCDFDG
jgi:carbamoyltransferase